MLPTAQTILPQRPPDASALSRQDRSQASHLQGCQISGKFSLLLLLLKKLYSIYDLQMAEEPSLDAQELETTLPTSVGSQKKQENFRKTCFCFIDQAKAFECVYHNKLWKILRDGNTRPSYLPPVKPVFRSRNNTQNWTWNNRLVPDRKRNTSRLYIVTLLI